MDFERETAKQRAAATATGQSGWGRIGSDADHQRYMYLLPGRYRNRRRCYCGCTAGKASHGVAANGVGLVTGCELSMHRWVKTGEFRTQTKLDEIRREYQRITAQRQRGRA
ncbi:hypothetical protein APR12_006362 [Nocardia amikacinitolerans]|uniref:hypothetical protein n=1 Tax=Nocardia amikacinitolerans TaxID=756689 RepID=UPI0008300EC7|nr:hypothetical protein [Nocardia amikacinitolerans]MCP2320972.1 hypothetical protein [Nocardia amikacinitolerans]